MQDFTRDSNRIKSPENPAINTHTHKETIEPKVGSDLSLQPMRDFIRARMNKDNCWNLVFWIGTSISVWIAQLSIGIIPGGGIILLFTIFLAPYLLAKINKVKVVDNKILTSSGRLIPELLPQSSGALLFVTFIAIFFWVVGSMAAGFNPLSFSDINFALWNTLLWLPTTMYFILKNYPINMFFNKATWAPEIVSEQNVRRKSKSAFEDSKYIMDPAYSFDIRNIHHHRRHR